MTGPERRARRLVRLYPPGWRERFGEEFAQLLVDEMTEHPRSAGRTADVAGHALLARFVARGLAGRDLDAREQAGRALPVLGVVAVVFGVIGIALWSQAAVGWTWATPTSPDTRIALGLMSVALLGLCACDALACLLVAGSLIPVRRAAIRPLILAALGLGALVVGCVHVGQGWPGAAAGWTVRGVVPADLARLGWAATLWVDAAWLHPGALSALPAGRLAWMVVSPLLLAVTALALIRAFSRARLSPTVLRALAGLGVVGTGFAVGFIAGAASWIVGAGPGPRQMFQAGAVDDLGLVILTPVLLAAAHVTRRSLVVVRRAPRR